jgi:Transposase IS66 family
MRNSPYVRAKGQKLLRCHLVSGLFQTLIKRSLIRFFFKKLETPRRFTRVFTFTTTSIHAFNEGLRVNAKSRRKAHARKRTMLRRINKHNWSGVSRMIRPESVKYELADKQQSIAVGGIGALLVYWAKTGVVDFEVIRQQFRDDGRSTSYRSMLRTANRLESAHQEVRRAVRGSPQVVGDETGWRVNGRSAWLRAFVGLTATCYEIDPTRSIEPAERLLGRDWSGIFGHDGWTVYNKFAKATHQQCFAHLLRRCESLIESGNGNALAFPRALKQLLLKGFEYRSRFRESDLTVHGMKVMAGRLTMQMWELVRHSKTDAANERFAKFLEKHLDDLLTFLRHSGADATNWRGEQAIRPAVVNRKVWGGNRSGSGP